MERIDLLLCRVDCAGRMIRLNVPTAVKGIETGRSLFGTGMLCNPSLGKSLWQFVYPPFIHELEGDLEANRVFCTVDESTVCRILSRHGFILRKD